MGKTQVLIYQPLELLETIIRCVGKLYTEEIIFHILSFLSHFAMLKRKLITCMMFKVLLREILVVEVVKLFFIG